MSNGDSPFRKLFDGMSRGALVYERSNGTGTAKFTATHANRASECLTGMSPADCVGKGPRELHPGFDADALLPLLHRVWETGRPEFLLLRSNGDDGSLRCHAFEIFRLDSGELVTIFEDVTERRREEEALRQREEEFRAITMNTPDHIIVMDRELKYRRVINPQMGLTQEEMIGHGDHDFLTMEDADRLTELKMSVLETGCSKFVKVPLLAADGSVQHFEGAYIPLPHPDGSANGLIGCFRNVTERITMEEALQKNLQRYEKAQRLGQVGNWEYDLSTELFWASDETKRIYGFAPDDATFSAIHREGPSRSSESFRTSPSRRRPNGSDRLWKSSSDRPRSSGPSASSPAASPTTSTTSSPRSSEMRAWPSTTSLPYDEPWARCSSVWATR